MRDMIKKICLTFLTKLSPIGWSLSRSHAAGPQRVHGGKEYWESPWKSGEEYHGINKKLTLKACNIRLILITRSKVFMPPTTFVK